MLGVHFDEPVVVGLRFHVEVPPVIEHGQGNGFGPLERGDDYMNCYEAWVGFDFEAHSEAQCVIQPGKSCAGIGLAMQ